MSKFSSDLDELIYRASLDGGPDEEIGDVQDFGWYGLMRFSKDDFEYFTGLAEEEGLELTEDDLETLKTSAGGVIYEDDQGFVDVKFFKTTDELESVWSDLQEEAEKFYGEGEGGESEEEDAESEIDL